jgi:hypothetical protein
MDLTPYVDKLREELAVAAEAGGPEARDLAERLTAPLESALRLTLLEALSAAADEITSDLAPGSVDVRLRGRDPQFVVVAVPGGTPPPGATAAVSAPAVDEAALTAGAASARINLRLPDDLKARVEAAAGRAQVSVNTWLVRAAAAALDSDHHQRTAGTPAADGSQRFTGWVR